MNMFRRLALTGSMTLSLGAISFGQHYTQTNLQANTSGTAEATDQQLVNPWGLSRTSGSAWWAADNATGVATLYNGPGTKQSLTVTVPPADPNNKNTPNGSPSGIIANGSTTDFVLPAGPAAFIFATLDGSIAAWNPNVGLANGAAPPSTHAVTVAKATDGSVYTGLTSALIGGRRYLFAANPSKGRVDVYDNAFHLADLNNNSGHDNFDNDHFSPGGQPFEDSQLPNGYVPFNVATVGQDIVVTYVLDPPGQQLPTAGPGFGYVDIFNSKGQLVQRLEHGSWLNVPWGVTLAPLDFGRFSHDLLVGQFANAGNTESAGVIAAYDLATGKFDGLLQDATGKPIVIEGIWSLKTGNVSPGNLDPDNAPAAQIYFTAGPKGQTAGLFGYLTAVPTELTDGSDQ
ncbi:MAG TPA: TIGR03118 family protein [Acidobacteriaceae bacterium]|jgi:uncharacterized protein (TIGR03118 family)